jgi:uncharacterized membrane protein YphA (DoxX/SURF4 family)
MGWLEKNYVVRGCQILIGLMFAWAALAKLGDLSAFATAVHNFRIVPVATENLLAVTLPWIELVASLALILNVQPRAGAVILTVLLTVFTLGIVLAMFRGLSFECGCFGKGDTSRVGMVKVLQNVGMLVVAVIATRRGR